MEVIDFFVNQQAEMPLLVKNKIKSIKKSRFIFSSINKSISNFKKGKGQRIVLLHGLRGTGKTTLLLQIYKKYKEKLNIFYISGDALLSHNIDFEDVILTLDRLNKHKIGLDKKFILLVDEVTYIQRWDLKFKVWIDQRPNLMMIATSSSSLGLKNSKELTRRAKNIPIFPLSFREYLAVKYNISIPDSFSDRLRKKIFNNILPESEYIKVFSYLKDYNLTALYKEYTRNDLPFSLEVSNEKEYEQAIKRMIKRVVYEDFPRFANLEAKILQKAEQMIYFISTIPSDGVKIQTISETIGISKETVTKLLNLFEQAMVIKGVSCQGRKRSFKKPLKWFFYSPSLRLALSSFWGVTSDLIGNLREDSVFLVLSQFDKDIFYSHGIDFIIEDIGFEVGKKKKIKKIRSSESKFKIFILSAEEGIEQNKIPLSLFALSI